MKHLLLTGSTGFVGRRLGSTLYERDAFDVEVLNRRTLRNTNSISENEHLGNFDGSEIYLSALFNKDIVIHAAASAHNNTLDPAELEKINVEGTLNLARQAADAGVGRFIFLSSIGVNGKSNERPFREIDAVNPTDPYSISKWNAERGLQLIAESTNMEVVIIRPPLVYGPNAPGNFGSLVRWVHRGIPLPLGRVHNKRSLVALDNLVDLVVTCIDHPAAANQVFLAGDGEDVSTTELLQRVGKAMGKPARLVPVPPGILIFGASLLDKKTVAQRLLGSLQVDISKARNVLGWKPPLSVEEGLRRCFDSEKIS